MRVLLIGLLLAAMGAVLAQEMPPIYTALRTDVPPQLRNGRTFVPVRAIAETFGATVTWDPATQGIRISQAGQPDIQLTIGSTTARVGDRTVTLDAAPFLEQGRAMVPLRFVAEAWGIPVIYNTPTRSVWIDRGDRRYILPLEDTRTGITIDWPRPNTLVRNPVLVQGQANVFEGALIVEVQTRTGQVLGRTTTTAGMGGFYPYRTQIYYNLPSDDPAPGRIVVYAEDPRGGNRPPAARETVNVTLASTI